LRGGGRRAERARIERRAGDIKVLGCGFVSLQARRRPLDKCRARRQPGARVQTFSKKNIWIHQENLAESSLFPWYKHAGGDENFCETSIVGALARILLPPRFFRRL
jgi:hypothetical protein